MTRLEVGRHFLTRGNGKLTKAELEILKNNEWLKILWLKGNTDDLNIENYDEIEKISPLDTLKYVCKTLEVLESEKENLSYKEFLLLEEVLCYCEVAKGGTTAMRKKWREKHFALYIHNIGSSQIFSEIKKDTYQPEYLNYISTLIKTHGLIGQYIRGETLLSSSECLVGLHYDDINHEKIIKTLNKCIISGVSMELYDNIKYEVNKAINDLLKNNMYNRLRKLRNTAIKNGEDFDNELKGFLDKYPDCVTELNDFLNHFDFWYIEAATSDFRLEETLKLFIYIQREIGKKAITDISFKSMMSFYCDYQGKKTINVFKERVIEKLLTEYDVNDPSAKLKNEHVELVFDYEDKISNTYFVSMRWQFSKISEKFIDFCIAAVGQGALYDQVITMACDHFGIRRDKYDRFYNEYEYLQTMNSTTELKKVLVDFIEGDKIIDVGPGGGGLMDAILEKFPEKQVTGIDVSKNVIDKLTKIKNIYGKKWNVVKGNALNLEETFNAGDFDTIIFCSILHELFSYIPYDDKKFNYDTLKKVFTSVYNILPKGGRLIIRDGIMSEDFSDRIIHFKNPEDISILRRYAKDFKGRKITYEQLTENDVKMPANDAMEFLYTYTWGEESYAHEINEQFGYFIPNRYIDFVTKCFEGNCKVVYSKHFLQEGYTEHLQDKITFYNEYFEEVPLPDSTFILVVEKL